MPHPALDIAGPGDIVVIDAGGNPTFALRGEIMVPIAQPRHSGVMHTHEACGCITR